MLISMVIPAFNEEKYLERTLERIQFAVDENRDRGFSWEIIVCDNNSTDRTAEIASRMDCKTVFDPINQISSARNTGARIAHGEWLLFIDADSFPRPELLNEMLDVIEHGKHIGCGATATVEEGTVFNKFRIERMNPVFRLFNWSGGAFLLCQSDAFQSIGGFNTNLYAYEEIDFVFRLKWYGRKTGRKFTVLHRYPVITSGRKTAYSFFSFKRAIVSNFFAALLFGVRRILPKPLMKKFRSKMLGYWYNCRQ